MPFQDPFWSPKVLLSKIYKNIKYLKEIEKSFLENGIKYVIEEGGELGYQHKIKQVSDIPEESMLIVADSFENVKSALDQTVYKASLLNGMPDSERRNASFPISKNKKSFETSLNGRCKYLSDSIKNIIRSMHPYEEGNKILWSVLQMANSTKHRSLEPVYIDSGKLKIEHLHIASGPAAVPIPKWDRGKREVIILETNENTKIDILNLILAIHLSLYDAYHISERPIIDILQYSYNITKYFIDKVSRSIT